MSRHAECHYDGPHRPHSVVVAVLDDARTLGDFLSAPLQEQPCPGEAEPDAWEQWRAGAGTWSEDQ